MTLIPSQEAVYLSDLQKKIEANHFNPSAAFYVSNEAIERVSNGEITLLDATNPTVFLLEMMSVSTSAAVNTNSAKLRTLYPSLAERIEDLYPHMSDEDYINRFAHPCTHKVGIMLPADSLFQRMLYDENEKCHKAIIPRDSYVTIGNIEFTFMYPVVIRHYDTGNLEISYDASKLSIFQSLSTNIIKYEVRSTPDGTRFITFEVPLLQVSISEVSTTIQAGRNFKTSVAFQDQFFHCRAFVRNSRTNNLFQEIRTTHSDFVYDQRTPTLVLQVNNGNLNMSIPQIYNQNSELIGDISILIYTTKGEIVEVLDGYDKKLDYRAFDTQRDLSDYTNISLGDVPRLVFASGVTTGGSNGLDFEKLRERVIFNSLGRQQLPITNSNLQAEVDQSGFEFIKNTDMVTSRALLASKRLPPPSNTKLITTTNMGVETFVVDISTIKNHPYIHDNGASLTLTPKCLFRQENGIVQLLTTQEMFDIERTDQTTFVNTMNASRFLMTPFYWVLDNENGFEVRAYHLDKPEASTINFMRQNQTLQLAVNSTNRMLEKTSTGYRLYIFIEDAQHYRNLPDSEVATQIMFYPEGEKTPVYLRGEQVSGSIEASRVFAVDFKTNLLIDNKDRLQIKDVQMTDGNYQDVWINLNAEFHIFHCTNSLTANYQADDSVNLYGPTLLPERMVPITHETITIDFGKPLKNLWTRCRNLPSDYDYEVHEVDVPLLYEEEVFEIDTDGERKFTIVNGKPHFNVIHNVGDPVLDNQGQPILKYRKGDVVIDPHTNLPVKLSTMTRYKEVDILMMDGRNYYVTEKAYSDYFKETIEVVVKWITEDLAAIQEKLLDKTQIFLHPKSQIGQCKIDRGDGLTMTIDAEQSPILDLYVPEYVFKDTKLRDQLQTRAIKVLNDMLSNKEINNSSIENALVGELGDAVTSLRLHGFGENHDIYYGLVISPTKQLSLKRILVVQADGTLFMKEDVTFNFYRSALTASA